MTPRHRRSPERSENARGRAALGRQLRQRLTVVTMLATLIQENATGSAGRWAEEILSECDQMVALLEREGPADRTSE